jgi:hypothetical protein
VFEKCEYRSNFKFVSRLDSQVVASELLGAKRVTARNISGFQAVHKPTRSLRRRSMSEGIGYDVSLGLPL